MKKKLLTCMLACVMSVSLFGCSSTSNSTAAEAKDGTYTATAQGFEKGDVKVTITVKDGKITDAEVDSSSQSKSYGADAAEGLAKEIVEAQSGDIDVVSGATATRDAVSEAVEDCMKQAGLSVAAKQGEDETLEADVVVVGMGASGTTAALRASEIKADAILMAKNGVDGVYNADPKKDQTATRFEHLTYMDLLNKGLQVMDSTATSMCMDNDMELVVFNMNEKGNIVKAMKGEAVCTRINKEEK